MYHSNQSAFWDYHDWIYQNQGEINPQNLDAKVQEVGMTGDRFVRQVYQELKANR